MRLDHAPSVNVFVLVSSICFLLMLTTRRFLRPVPRPSSLSLSLSAKAS